VAGDSEAEHPESSGEANAVAASVGAPLEEAVEAVEGLGKDEVEVDLGLTRSGDDEGEGVEGADDQVHTVS
jgi:hypothetical protein